MTEQSKEIIEQEALIEAELKNSSKKRIYQILAQNPHFFHLVPKEIVNKEFILHLIFNKCPINLIPASFFEDKEICLHAISSIGDKYLYNFDKIPKKFLNDIEFIKDVLHLNPYYLQNLPSKYHNNESLVLELISHNCYIFSCCSKRLQYSHKFCIKAINANQNVYFELLSAIKNDDRIIKALLRKNIQYLEYLPEHIQNNKWNLERLSQASSNSITNSEWYNDKLEILNSLREKEYMELESPTSTKKNITKKF